MKVTWPQDCPACGYTSSATLSIDNGQNYVPEAGDVGICFGCGVKQTFDEQGILRLLSGELESSLPFHLKTQLNSLQKLWFHQRTRAS